MSNQYTLYYFDIRGRAEPIRLLLAYAGVKYEDRGLGGDDWARMKPQMPFGQMPVLKQQGPNGERMIPQSMAIMRHLAREHGLEGNTSDERVSADIANETAVDARSALSSLRYSPAWSDEAAKEKFIRETAQTHFGRLDKLLGSRDWFSAAAPLWSDFTIFDTLERHTDNWPACLDQWPKLTAFMNRVRALPQLKSYLASRRAA